MHIQANHISFTYPGGKRALDDVSIDLTSPNLIGLLGPNGAGKTTLMKLLVAGLLPTSGEILLDGKPLKKQEKLLNVALNRIEGQWDYEKLQDLFEEFSAEDIFATGYSDGELKTLFGGEDEDPTDLYQDDPEPEEDDDGDDTEEDDGEFSIYLSFPTRQAAEEWLEGEGIERGFPRGGRNLVIHMEGDSYEDTRN